MNCHKEGMKESHCVLYVTNKGDIFHTGCQQGSV